jgi:hypothetical protein
VVAALICFEAVVFFVLLQAVLASEQTLARLALELHHLVWVVLAMMVLVARET